MIIRWQPFRHRILASNPWSAVEHTITETHTKSIISRVDREETLPLPPRSPGVVVMVRCFCDFETEIAATYRITNIILNYGP